MRTYAEKNNILRKPRRMLIGSYFGKEVLINIALAKWYLSHGLEITQIHEFIQFHSERCFLNLAERIANAQREADVNPSKQILALTQKLTGNSLYSATLLNKEKHRDLTYHTDPTISKTTNQPNFASLNPISTALYEVQSLKKKISHNLPIYVGVGVYLNAKLRMFEFYYDFLLKFVSKDQFELVEMDTDSFYPWL